MTPKSARPTYIRVKRDRTIIFLCIEPSSKIVSIKENIVSVMTNVNKPIEDIRLYLATNSTLDQPAVPLSGRLLEDNETAKSAGIENDALVYLVYFDHQQGKWEDIQVAEFESLDDDMEEDAMEATEDVSKKKEKGKGRA